VLKACAAAPVAGRGRAALPQDVRQVLPACHRPSAVRCTSHTSARTFFYRRRDSIPSTDFEPVVTWRRPPRVNPRWCVITPIMSGHALVPLRACPARELRVFWSNHVGRCSWRSTGNGVLSFFAYYGLNHVGRCSWLSTGNGVLSFFAQLWTTWDGPWAIRKGPLKPSWIAHMKWAHQCDWNSYGTRSLQNRLLGRCSPECRRVNHLRQRELHFCYCCDRFPVWLNKTAPIP